MPLWVSSSVSIVVDIWSPFHLYRRNPIALLALTPMVGIQTGIFIGPLLAKSFANPAVRYTVAAINIALCSVGFYSIPRSNVQLRQSQTDYTWLSIIGIAFGLLAHPLSAIWIRPSSISDLLYTIMLSSSLALILAFALWKWHHWHEGPTSLIYRDLKFALLGLCGLHVWATIPMNLQLAALFAMVTPVSPSKCGEGFLPVLWLALQWPLMNYTVEFWYLKIPPSLVFHEL